MCYIQNRSTTDGLRHTLLFFFSYNWYAFNKKRTYEELLERSIGLNAYFNPPLEEPELVKAVQCNINTLQRNEILTRAIRNTTIQNYLHFTEQEKQYCCIGLYYDTYEEYLTHLREKRIRYSKMYYDNILEENGTMRQVARKEMYKKMLLDNPLMSYAEFKRITGLSKSTYDIYKRENGTSKEKYKELHAAYYLRPFIENPNITKEEYMDMLSCSISTFNKYKRMFKIQQ